MTCPQRGSTPTSNQQDSADVTRLGRPRQVSHSHQRFHLHTRQSGYQSRRNSLQVGDDSAGGGEPSTIGGPTSPSSVPTGVSSVTISSSISLRRRAEPETGQPGSRICESRSPIRETEPPEIASARSSSRADSLPDDNAPVGLLLSVGERSRAGAATSRLLDVHQYGGGVAVKPDGDLIGVHPRQRIPRPCPTATNTASPYAPNPPGEPRRQAGRCPDHRSRRSRE